MTFRAISRCHVVTAVTGLILAASTMPGSAAGDVPTLQDADPHNLKPGQIATIAGTGPPVEYENDDDAGDGGPAVQAPLGPFMRIDVSPDGTVYVVDERNERLRVIDPDGAMDPVTDAYVSREPEGDDWPPGAVAFDPAGRLYVTNRDIIQRADANGGFETIAGGGDATLDEGGDGGPATEAALHATSVDVGVDGTVYVADNNSSSPRIRKITDGGLITTIAGGGDLAIDASDGQDATDARLDIVGDVVVDSQSTVYFAELISSGENRGSHVRKIAADGTISTVVGGGESGFSGDGWPR